MHSYGPIATSELELQFLILTMIKGHIEQLFFHMDRISLAYAFLKPTWSFPVLSLAFGPSYAFVRKRRVFTFQTSKFAFVKNCQCVHQGGDCGYHGDMLEILG